MDVLALMDSVKLLLQVQLDVNLKSLDQAASLRPSQLEFEEQYDEIAKVLSRNLTDKSYTEVASVMSAMLVLLPASGPEMCWSVMYAMTQACGNSPWLIQAFVA